LAYCIDGGLLSNFTLKNLYTFLEDPGTDQVYRYEIMVLFDYLLYAIPESNGANSDFIPGEFVKRL
jgi:hypothetical protein